MPILPSASSTETSTLLAASFPRVEAPFSTENRPGAGQSLLNLSPPGPPHVYMERVPGPNFEISSREAPSPKEESFDMTDWLLNGRSYGPPIVCTTSG
jgi:hypothetical protein